MFPPRKDIIPWGTYPQVRVPIEPWVNVTVKWAEENVKPEHANKRVGGTELYPGSPFSFNVQFRGRIRDAAHFIYYGVPFEEYRKRLKHEPDDYDIPLAPAFIDGKGSDHGDRTTTAPYSIKRLEKIPFEKNKFTHLSMVRAQLIDPYLFEMCGWMEKQEYQDRHLEAPHPDYPQTETWVPGTWFVPIAWLHPAVQLRSYRGPFYDEEDHFIHWCQYPLCGKEASFGKDSWQNSDKLGRWYCAEHVRRPLVGAASR